jgi:hypothetical protein
MSSYKSLIDQVRTQIPMFPDVSGRSERRRELWLDRFLDGRNHPCRVGLRGLPCDKIYNTREQKKNIQQIGTRTQYQ